MGVLPGGLSRRRALAVVLRRAPRRLLPAWTSPVREVAAGGIAALAGMLLLTRLWPGALPPPGSPAWILAAALVTLAMVLIALAALGFEVVRRPPGALHRLGPEHADLHALVAEVAAELGVRPPRRLYAWACPDAMAVRPAPGRRELWIGLPYLTELSRAELRCLVAHELALLRGRRSRAADAMYALWAEEPEPPPEAETVAAALLGEAAAAARVSGAQTAALTLIRTQALRQSFLWFTDRYGTPAAVALDGFPLDLYAAWRWKVREDLLVERGWPRTRTRLAGQPLTLRRLCALGGDPAALTERPPPREPGPPALPGGLPGPVEARLARHHLRWWLADRYRLPNAGSLHGVPDQVWDAHLEERLDGVRRLLGMPAGTPARGVAEAVAAGWTAGWTAGEPPCEWACPHAVPAVCALIPAIHRTLREAGYAYADPLRLRVLVGWDGGRTDVVSLAEAIAGGGPVGALLPMAAKAPDVS
ncbi:hypothetical protein DP939_15405 [Spongiactinospora rosea]|uniref:Zn-dependent protease with chaperone function n=1 Tax=Spongiactinospora rosea TaxID=2248750 RepID=A0A366M158_9ACTN|nr:hypothetical protein [Spongiactinospora rosea]RBQ19314.1 hypothetical protein DP939_15405 [Spongiactinospora rosea]